MRPRLSLPLLLALASATALAAPPPKPWRSSAEVIATAPAADWREPKADDLLVMELPQGRVLIELAPRFAPRHVANIRALARAGYWDGLAVLRVQDNYVAQWGDPEAEKNPAGAKPLPPGLPKPGIEFALPFKGLPFQPLPERDAWASVQGFVEGFPVAADPKRNQAWLSHCYGMVGAGRDMAVDSSNGAELYAMIAPARALDLNVPLVGRVLQGIELLSSLPRGSGALGFYEKPEQRTPITRVRLAADLPEAERPALQVLRTDSASWTALLQARRWREGWFVHSHGAVDLCSVSVPVRERPR
jgi:peptidylprolyl isomerase